MWKYYKCNKKGFTLTEVMIGIMILTVAIVSASNLLVSLIHTNKTNVKVLQAYYLAQEGIEAVRNIRDTNWLHNLDFKGGGIYEELEVGSAYNVSLKEAGWANSNNQKDLTQIQVDSLKPWNFVKVSEVLNLDPFRQEFALTKNEYQASVHYFSNGSPEDAVFYRHIEILPYCKEGAMEEDCENFVLVRAVVNWKDGNDDGEMSLEMVLSNWKGGAM